MSYLICLHHHCHFQITCCTLDVPTEEAHQSWSMCWSPQWPWSWWPSPGGWNIVRQWDPILWLTTLTLGALQLEKWTKTKLQGLIYSVLTLAWYNSDSIFLFFLMICLICLLCWRVGFQTFPMLLNNHPAFITNLPTFSKVLTTVANALAPQGCSDCLWALPLW